jgi:hypothetical protein
MTHFKYIYTNYLLRQFLQKWNYITLCLQTSLRLCHKIVTHYYIIIRNFLDPIFNINRSQNYQRPLSTFTTLPSQGTEHPQSCFRQTVKHTKSELRFKRIVLHYIAFPGSKVSQNDCRIQNMSYKYKNTYSTTEVFIQGNSGYRKGYFWYIILPIYGIYTTFKTMRHFLDYRYLSTE